MASEPAGIEDLRIVPAASHVNAYLGTWVPYFIAKGTFDSAWTYQLFPWEKIVGHPLYEVSAAVDGNNSLEGMIAFAKTNDPGAGLQIAFLATAPWNYGSDRLRRNVGTGLVGFAIQKSLSLGHNGGLTLSSTRESETFYERLQFARTGNLDHEQLAIFTLSPARATAFIQIHTALLEG